jgi:hypothetical protein
MSEKRKLEKIEEKIAEKRLELGEELKTVETNDELWAKNYRVMIYHTLSLLDEFSQILEEDV